MTPHTEDQLETMIREALHERAQEVPTDALRRTRIAGVELRAAGAAARRPRRWRALATVGGAAGIAAVAVVAAVALNAASPKVEAAFAGWSATPTRVERVDPATADTNPGCRRRLDAGDEALIAEQRGPYTLIVLADSHGASREVCISDGDRFQFGMAIAPDGDASGVVAKSTGRSGNIQISSGSDSSPTTMTLSSEEGDLTLLSGKVAKDATAVRVTRTDGVVVDATVRDGAVVAWWPGTAAAKLIEVTTPSGTTSQEIGLDADQALDLRTATAAARARALPEPDAVRTVTGGAACATDAIEAPDQRAQCR